MRYVVGIDAGGSKTVGLLVDEEARLLRQVRAGGANLRVHGENGVEAVLKQILHELSAPGPVAAICLGLAGVDRPADRAKILRILGRLGFAGKARVENDALVALVAGAPERLGIVVVSGTGSIAYGLDSHGTTARAGGWGYILGDEGSGYWLGHAALRQAIRALDGRGPETTFGDRVARKLGLEMPAGLVSWFYDQERSRYRIAELASLVEEAALDGDRQAEELLEEAALHLVRAAQSVASQLSFDAQYRVVLAGGAFRACPSLARRVEDHFDLPLAMVDRLDREPAWGAVALALDLLEEKNG